MTDNEKLIEEAGRRKAMNVWPMDMDGRNGLQSRKERELLRRGFELGFKNGAVFMKAHTPTDDFPHGHPEMDPTDDEREALWDAFDDMHRITEGGCDTRGDHVADMVLGLGFRRSEVPEPSAEEEYGEYELEELDESGYFETQGEPSERGDAMYAALRAANEAR